MYVNMVENNKRIQWLDFAKGFIILLVVACHAGFRPGIFFSLLEYVLLILVMPLFFAISGFLYKPANTWYKYKILLYKKIGSFVIPYIIFTIIDVILRMTSNHNPLDSFYRIYLIPVGYLWFLYSLFLIFIIVGLMNLLHFKLWIQIFISIVLLFSQIYLPWQESAKGNMNPLAGIGGYMICFYIGYLIKKFHISKYLKNLRLLISINFIWIITIIIGITITGMEYNPDVFNYGDIITKLLSIPVFFSMFVNIKHNEFFKYFDKYGKYTLVIYLIHLPIISTISKVVYKTPLSNTFITNSVMLFAIFVVCSWYGSIYVCHLAKRYKWINFIFYPRKYIDKVILKTEWGKRLLLK